MSSKSLSNRLSGLPSNKTNDDLRVALESLLAGVQAALDSITAKLDADAGVTDTNYTATAQAALATKITR
jgi:hypothetical protein